LGALHALFGRVKATLWDAASVAPGSVSSLQAMLRTLTWRFGPGWSSQESDAAASLSVAQMSANRLPSQHAADATTPAVFRTIALGPDAGSAGPGPGSGITDSGAAGRQGASGRYKSL